MYYKMRFAHCDPEMTLMFSGVVEQLCQMVSERNLLAPLSKLLLQCSVLSATGITMNVDTMKSQLSC